MKARLEESVISSSSSLSSDQLLSIQSMMNSYEAAAAAAVDDVGPPPTSAPQTIVKVVTLDLPQCTETKNSYEDSLHCYRHYFGRESSDHYHFDHRNHHHGDPFFCNHLNKVLRGTSICFWRGFSPHGLIRVCP